MKTDQIELPRPEILVRVAKDEMNLAEFPITLLSDRVPSGQNEIVYQDQVYDSSLSRTIDRKVTITASEKYGLPTAIDDDVLLALIQLTNRANGFNSREVTFTRYELTEILQWPVNGQNYQRLADSLRRWMNVTLEYENAWWNKKQTAWTTTAFHILDNFEINASRGKKSQGELFASTITWNKVVFASFEAGYLKTIDYGLYINLKSQVAKRLYRFLSKRFYHHIDFNMSLRDLAFAHVGISRNYKDAGKVKEKLHGGFEELESIGFLARLKREERYFKSGKEWSVRLVAGKKGKQTENFARPAAEEKQESAPAPAWCVKKLAEDGVTGSVHYGCVKELTERGVARSVAELLVQVHGEAKVGLQIEILDWYTEYNPNKIKDPAAWLVAAIRSPEGHVAPKGFQWKADQTHENDAKKEAAQKAEQARVLRLSQNALQADLAVRVETFWKNKSPQDQAEHDRMALEDASETDRECYRLMTHPRLKASLLKKFRDDYSLKFLAETC